MAEMTYYNPFREQAAACNHLSEEIMQMLRRNLAISNDLTDEMRGRLRTLGIMTPMTHLKEMGQMITTLNRLEIKLAVLWLSRKRHMSEVGRLPTNLVCLVVNYLE